MKNKDKSRIGTVISSRMFMTYDSTFAVKLVDGTTTKMKFEGLLFWDPFCPNDFNYYFYSGLQRFEMKLGSKHLSYPDVDKKEIVMDKIIHWEETESQPVELWFDKIVYDIGWFGHDKTSWRPRPEIKNRERR